MDTKYWQQAMQEWCAKHKFDSNMPITMLMLSEIAQRAQQLKDADRKKMDAPDDAGTRPQDK